MKDILESIKAKRKEADLLYKTLDMWNDVSGLVDPDSVECFGFDPKLLTPAQLREATGPAGYHGNHSPSNPYGWPIRNGRTRPTKYNYVGLKDGSKVQIPLIDAPECR